MGDTVLIETTADEAVTIVTQGPQGASGSEAATLTTTGDLLYRDALANDRLPIGSEGQVLKVASGLPAWGAETVASVNGATGAVSLAQNDIPETLLEDEITSTNSASPTEISLQSYYSVANKGLRVRVMLDALAATSFGAVRLPELSSNETGFVTVRLSTDGNVGQLKVTLNDQAQTPIYPASGYDEIAADTDYTFRWIGDRWEMDILPNENATTASALNKPDHSGFLAAFRSYGSPPATPTSTGSRGQLAFGYDDGAERLYICVADNVWRRVPIATWT